MSKNSNSTTESQNKTKIYIIAVITLLILVIGGLSYYVYAVGIGQNKSSTKTFNKVINSASTDTKAVIKNNEIIEPVIFKHFETPNKVDLNANSNPSEVVNHYTIEFADGATLFDIKDLIEKINQTDYQNQDYKTQLILKSEIEEEDKITNIDVKFTTLDNLKSLQELYHDAMITKILTDKEMSKIQPSFKPDDKIIEKYGGGDYPDINYVETEILNKISMQQIALENNNQKQDFLKKQIQNLIPTNQISALVIKIKTPFDSKLNDLMKNLGANVEKVTYNLPESDYNYQIKTTNQYKLKVGSDAKYYKLSDTYNNFIQAVKEENQKRSSSGENASVAITKENVWNDEARMQEILDKFKYKPTDIEIPSYKQSVEIVNVDSISQKDLMDSSQSLLKKQLNKINQAPIGGAGGGTGVPREQIDLSLIQPPYIKVSNNITNLNRQKLQNDKSSILIKKIFQGQTIDISGEYSQNNPNRNQQFKEIYAQTVKSQREFLLKNLND